MLIDDFENDEDEQNASARERMNEKELKRLNDNYKNLNDEPESQNVANILKQGVRTKNTATLADRVFEPFKIPNSKYNNQANISEVDS